MVYELYGPYKSMDDAVSNVEVLGLKGFRAGNINVIAEEDVAAELDERVDATIISTLRKFDDDAEEHLERVFRHLNMSDRQAERYKDSIKANEIIIAVDPNYHRMGNEHIRDTEALEVLLH